ncbi:hypothetical protein OUZ56_017640 [Daphnia magna]|uniref:GMP synthase n=1 Tax=Daphnia magna TaxID=35525 RepID=A0ABR0ATI3_9CRUS|nr:hypothetical protein OUZ56_017640 [Daphnia magna]
MTGLPAIPDTYLPQEVVEVEAVSNVPGISRVLCDLTAKPPGTTEWEGFDLRTLLRQMISALFIGHGYRVVVFEIENQSALP